MRERGIKNLAKRKLNFFQWLFGILIILIVCSSHNIVYADTRIDNPRFTKIFIDELKKNFLEALDISDFVLALGDALGNKISNAISSYAVHQPPEVLINTSRHPEVAGQSVNRTDGEVITRIINEIHTYSDSATITEQELIEIISNSETLKLLLKGEKGDQGERGEDGKTGVQGPPGYSIGQVNAPSFSSNIPGTIAGVTYLSANDFKTSKLTVSTSDIFFSALDCSSKSNGGVLTANSSGKIICEDDDSGIASLALSSITAASASNIIANGDNAQQWNWSLTTAAKTAFTFGETAAAINGVGNQSLIDITTASGSTASPLRITSAGTANILVNLSSTGDFHFQDNGTNFASFNDNGSISFAPSAGQGVTIAPLAAASGTPNLFTITGPAHTNLTAAEVIDVNFNLARTVEFFSNGQGIALQRAVLIQSPAYSINGAIDDAIALSISGAPAKGTNNTTLNRTHALHIAAGAVGGAGNSYGLTVNAQTGATNNYAAVFSGGSVGIGTIAPRKDLEIASASGPGIYLSDTDVTHNMTTQVPTDVFGYLQQISGTQGGLKISGYSDAAGGTGLQLIGTIGDTSPTAGVPALELRGHKKATGATTHQDLNVSDTLLGVTYDKNGGNYVLTMLGNGDTTLSQRVTTTGSPTLFTLTGAAHTTLTASTEASDVNLNFARTVQFATGAIANQRVIKVQAPTYGFVAASTITNASTLYIDAAPAAGTNATITNSYAMFIDAGAVRMDGLVSVGLGTTSSTSAVCSSLANATAPLAGTAYELRDCDNTPAADYSEMYPVGYDVEDGDVVMTSIDIKTTSKGTKVSKLVRAEAEGATQVIGIVSDQNDVTDFNTIGYDIKETDNPKAIALKGRVLVKISNENGLVKAGDRLTISKNYPGHAAKMIESGQAIGVALENSDDQNKKIMAFVNLGYQKIDVALDSSTGKIVYDKHIDMSGMNILNVNSVTSISGNWSISADGILHARQLCLEDVCINKDQLKSLLENTRMNGHAKNPEETRAISEESKNETSEIPVKDKEIDIQDPIIKEDDGKVFTEPEKSDIIYVE